MIEVSDAWKAAHRQTILPETFVEISIDAFDSGVSADISRVEDSPAATFSNSAAIVNAISYPTNGEYALLEQNLWLLDGSKQVVSSVASYDAPGYVSEEDAVGVVTVYTGTERKYEIPGFTIVWSAEHDEYATDFEVVVYLDSERVRSKRITNNDSVTSVVPMTESVIYDSFNRVTVTINKWNVPNHRKRIDSLCYGFHWVFDKSEILSYTHEQCGDIFSAEVSKNEITFSLDNSNDLWNPLNPQGLGRHLSEQQRVSVRYGMDVNGVTEWIPGGQFFLSEWNASSNGLEANFVAKDVLGVMENTLYSRSYITGVARNPIMSDDPYIYSEPDLYLDPDPEEDSEKIVGTVLPGETYALHEIFGNTMCKIAHIDSPETVLGWCSRWLLDYNNYVEQASLKTLLLGALGSVDLPDTFKTNYIAHADNEYGEEYMQKSETIWKVDSTPVSEIVQMVSNASGCMHKTDRGGSLLLIWDWPYDCEVLPLSDYVIPLDVSISYPEVSLNKVINAVEIVENPYSSDESPYVYRDRTVNTGSKDGRCVTVNNPLIVSRGSDLYRWYSRYAHHRTTVMGEFRADPRLDLFDKVAVETKYGTMTPVIITRIKYTFNGTLWGSFEGKYLHVHYGGL